MDKHVKNAYAKNKTTTYFVQESSRVIPEIFRIPPEMKKIYTWARCGKTSTALNDILDPISTHNATADDPQAMAIITMEETTTTGKEPTTEETTTEKTTTEETEMMENINISSFVLETEFEFVTRIQLVTGKNKTDTYYARFGENLLFIKGPYKDDTIIQQFIQLQNEKKALHMPYIENVQCIHLIPDRWPEGTPLGIRNKLSRTQKYPFMICKSLYDYDELTIKLHSSTLWPMTEVVDTTPHDINIFDLTTNELIDYFTIIAFRIMKNAGDFGDRNFLLKGGRVYSVDEEICQKRIVLRTCLRNKRYEYIQTKYPIIKHMLNKWVVSILDQEFI